MHSSCKRHYWYTSEQSLAMRHPTQFGSLREAVSTANHSTDTDKTKQRNRKIHNSIQLNKPTQLDVVNTSSQARFDRLLQHSARKRGRLILRRPFPTRGGGQKRETEAWR